MKTVPNSLLTVALVEGIHSAAIAGNSSAVLSAVAQLTDATLPGLVEYQCLRHAGVLPFELPELPVVVRCSLVGAALGQVACPFGCRTSGRSYYSSSVNPSPAEFFVLHTDADCESHEYKLFETRWARASEQAGLRGKQTAMQLALNAMSENGILHAASGMGVLVGYRMLEDTVLFTVADLGRGVLGSLKASPRYSHLQHHRDALRLALQAGVTSLDSAGGYGFHQVFKALTSQFGTIRFRTGDVCITMDGQSFESDLGEESYPETITGFQVTVCCRRRPASETSAPVI